MDALTVSEAQQWRRCSLAGLAVLAFSVAGETILNAHAQPAARRSSCSRSWTYEPETKTFRFLDHFATPAAR